MSKLLVLTDIIFELCLSATQLPNITNIKHIASIDIIAVATVDSFLKNSFTSYYFAQTKFLKVFEPTTRAGL